MYLLTYTETQADVEELGTFEDWAGLARLIVKECTLIFEESGHEDRDALLLSLSCWTLKLMASDIVSFDTLDCEKLVYSYPNTGTTGAWVITLI